MDYQAATEIAAKMRELYAFAKVGDYSRDTLMEAIIDIAIHYDTVAHYIDAEMSEQEETV